MYGLNLLVFDAQRDMLIKGERPALSPPLLAWVSCRSSESARGAARSLGYSWQPALLPTQE